MNWNEIAKRLSGIYGISVSEATKYTRCIFDIISDGLADRKEEISIHGFGKFVTTRRPARKGRNPATGEKIDVPATIQIRFKPYSALKNHVNGV